METTTAAGGLGAASATMTIPPPLIGDDAPPTGAVGENPEPAPSGGGAYGASKPGSGPTDTAGPVIRPKKTDRANSAPGIRKSNQKQNAIATR